MMKIGARALALAALAAALAPAAASAQTATAEQNGRAVHAFLSAVDVGEVQTSTLAQERAANAEVKAFAAAMVSGHTGALHTREAQVEKEGEGLFEAELGHAAAGPAGGDAQAAAAPSGALTAAQLQSMQAALEQNPASRTLATAGARNFQVLQGVTGAGFDATYMDAQIAGHRYALGALDRMIAQGGVTDEMLALMRTTRGAIAQHLEQAQAIRARLQ